jgi:CxxC motif-containing protein
MKFLCVSCPFGCSLTAEHDGGKLTSVSGNACAMGERYAASEVSAPVRYFTSTVRTAEGTLPRCPVRSRSPLPLSLIFAVKREIDGIEVKPPVEIGQTIIKNVLETGVDIIASRPIPPETAAGE